jgi:chromatin remodeling complex protein RSC6
MTAVKSSAKVSKSSSKPKVAPKSATKVVKKSPKPVPVASPPPVVAPPVTIDDSQTVSSVAPDSVTIENTMTQTLTQFQETILSLTIALNKLKTDFKILEKQVIKEARAMDKVNAKRNKNKGARAPSGFVKPTAISKDLAKFLGVDSDVKMARTDVTKLITAYVKEHKLQAPENGRKILPDKKLMALLGSDPKDEVTYFNLQSYMKSHFIKTDAPLV